MARTKLREEDTGKRVLDADGDIVGVISGFKGDEAYVDPDPGLGDRLRSRLGWDRVDEDDYPLDDSRVDRVTDDEVHLGRVR